MSDEEFLANLKNIDNEKLIQSLQNCGHDGYYNDLYYPIIEEIKRRLSSTSAEQEMNDLISRQAAIDAVHKEFDEVCVWDESGQTTANEVENILYELPSVEPERTAKAEMLEELFRTSMTWEGKCSSCGCYTIHEMNYCFGCGSKLYWGE